MDILNNIAEKRKNLISLLENKDNRTVLHNRLKTDADYVLFAAEQVDDVKPLIREKNKKKENQLFI